MIRRLALHPRRGGAVQWNFDYRSHEFIVTVAGQPIVACTTREERDDEMDSISQEVRTRKENAPAPALRPVSQQDRADLFG